MVTSREKAVDKFVDELGLIAEGEGLSRIAGKIMALAIVEGGPFSFSYLASRLEVSRGSISTNTRLLERLGVIERVVIRGDRQDHFRLTDTPYAQLLEGSAERLKKAHQLVAQAKVQLAGSDQASQHRLADLAGFYKALSDNFLELAKRFSNAD